MMNSRRDQPCSPGYRGVLITPMLPGYGRPPPRSPSSSIRHSFAPSSVALLMRRYRVGDSPSLSRGVRPGGERTRLNILFSGPIIGVGPILTQVEHRYRSRHVLYHRGAPCPQPYLSSISGGSLLTYIVEPPCRTPFAYAAAFRVSMILTR